MPLDEEAELDYKDEDSERDSDSDSDQSSDDEVRHSRIEEMGGGGGAQI